MRDNLNDLEKFEQERTAEKASILVTKLNRQAEEYRKKQQEKRPTKQETEQDKSEGHEESL